MSAPVWVAGDAVAPGLSPYLLERLGGAGAALGFAPGLSVCRARMDGGALRIDPPAGAAPDDALALAARDARVLDAAVPLSLAPRALAPDDAAPGPGDTRGACPDALRDARALLAAVDLAPAFAHERFRRADGGSRLDYLWLQDVPHDGAAGGPPFGRVWTGQALDALLARWRRGGGVDEEGLYRAVGMIDLARPDARAAARAATHGTAVLDRLGGAPPGGRAAGDAVDRDPAAFPLAAVGLPEGVVSDTSGAFNAFFVMAGIDRLLRHAAARGRARGRPLPVVVTIALGLTGGSKEGTGTLERYLARVAAASVPGLGPVRFVLPSGNHRQSRQRAVVEAAMGPDDRPLWWRLPPDDATPSFLEIWGRRRDARPDACGLSVLAAPPGLPATAPLAAPAFDRLHALRLGGRTVLRALAQWVPDPPGHDAPRRGRELLTLIAPPTRPERHGADAAPPGDWLLAVAAAPGIDPAAPFPCDLFIQRDDTLTGRRRLGRQSRFRDDAFRPRDAGGR